MLIVRVELGDGEGEEINGVLLFVEYLYSSELKKQLVNEKSKRLLSHPCLKFAQPTNFSCCEKSGHTSHLF